LQSERILDDWTKNRRRFCRKFEGRHALICTYTEHSESNNTDL